MEMVIPSDQNNSAELDSVAVDENHEKTEFNTLPSLSHDNFLQDTGFKAAVVKTAEKNHTYTRQREDCLPYLESNTGVPHYNNYGDGSYQKSVTEDDLRFGYVGAAKRSKVEDGKEQVVGTPVSAIMLDRNGVENRADCYLNYDKKGLEQLDGIQGQINSNSSQFGVGGYGEDDSARFNEDGAANVVSLGDDIRNRNVKYVNKQQDLTTQLNNKITSNATNNNTNNTSVATANNIQGMYSQQYSVNKNIYNAVGGTVSTAVTNNMYGGGYNSAYGSANNSNYGNVMYPNNNEINYAGGIQGIGSYDSNINVNANTGNSTDINGYYNNPLNIFNNSDVSGLYNIGDNITAAATPTVLSPSVAKPPKKKREVVADANGGFRKASTNWISSPKTAKFDKNDPRIQKLVARIDRFSPEVLAYKGEPNKPYACEICHRRYKNQGGVKYHYYHVAHTDREIGAVLSQPRDDGTSEIQMRSTSLNPIADNSGVGASIGNSNNIPHHQNINNLNPMLFSSSTSFVNEINHSNDSRVASPNVTGLQSLNGGHDSRSMGRQYYPQSNNNNTTAATSVFHHQGNQQYNNYLSSLGGKAGTSLPNMNRNLPDAAVAHVNDLINVNVNNVQAVTPSLSTLSSLLANDA